jgi:hypothetical protein
VVEPAEAGAKPAAKNKGGRPNEMLIPVIVNRLCELRRCNTQGHEKPMLWKQATVEINREFDCDYEMKTLQKYHSEGCVHRSTR